MKLITDLIFLDDVDSAYNDKQATWFKDLVLHCNNIAPNPWAEMEAAYKGETGKTTMPNVYRSAKSVISNALKLGIVLTQNGEALGKSALQAAIKAVKEADKVEGSSVENLMKEWYKLRKMHGFDDAKTRPLEAEFRDNYAGYETRRRAASGVRAKTFSS